MFGYSQVKNYLDLAYHPVETSITNHDDLVHLLVRLGASVNRIPKYISSRNYSNTKDKMSLKDWIDDAIETLNLRIEVSRNPRVKPPAPPIAPLPECSGWQKFRREYEESLKMPIREEERKRAVQEADQKEERQRLERLEKLEDAKAYVVEVKQLIEDHGAKTLKEIDPTVDPKPTIPTYSTPSSKAETHTYLFLSSSYGACGNVPRHLLSSYDELYEACYVGDNEKIQTLCLPAEGAIPGSILLNISVKMMDSSVNHCNLYGKRLSVL